MNALLLLAALALTPAPPPPPSSSRARTPDQMDVMPVDDERGRESSDDTGVGLIGEMEPMMRPQLISGESAQYTKEALENRVEGVLIAKCRMSVDGSVRACRVIKGLPYLNDAAVRALESRKYTPVKVRDKPVAVDYVFNLKFTLPPSAKADLPPKLPVRPLAAGEPVMRCNAAGDFRTFDSLLVGRLLTLLGLFMLVLQRTPLWKLVPLSAAWRKTPALSTLFALAFAGFAAVWTLSTWFFS